MEPGEPYREDIRTAWICLHIMQAVKSATGSKGGKLHLKDFMLDIDRYESHGESEEGKRKRVKEIKNKMLQWAKLHNKSVKNKKRSKE